MKKRIFIIGLCISSVLSVCSGCTIENGDGNKGYSTQNGLTAYEYSNMLGQEVNTILNQLTTRMSLGKLVADGTVSGKSESENTDFSIQVVKDCINEIKLLNPSTNAKNDSEEVIRLSEATLDALYEYKDSVEKENAEKIRENISILQSYFISLTATTNVVYQ